MDINEIKNILDKQKEQWDNSFTNIPDMFEKEESYSARKALKTIIDKNYSKILELGGGQGRDTLYFAKNNLKVDVLDYSKASIQTIIEKSKQLGVYDNICANCYDIRNPLPYADKTFDICYSHMLYCMALTISELKFLTSEVRRVLKPGGLNIFTVRNTKDKHFGLGNYIRKDMYEIGGFIVHYFNKEKIKKLSKGYEIIEIHEFEEGKLPKKLYYVSMKKI